MAINLKGFCASSVSNTVVGCRSRAGMNIMLGLKIKPKQFMDIEIFVLGSLCADGAAATALNKVYKAFMCCCSCRM